MFKKLLLGSLLIVSALGAKEACSSSFKLIPINQVDLQKMELVKESYDAPDRVRSIYYDKGSDLFFKIWSKEYKERGNFVRAFVSHYYCGLTSLEGVIIDENQVIRGYTTRNLQPADGLSLHPNGTGHMNLEDADRQPPGYQLFMKEIVSRSLSHGLYYLDLVPTNVITDGKAFYLVDLECVYTREELTKLYWSSRDNFEFILAHLPDDYASFLSQVVENVDCDLLKRAWTIPMGGAHAKPYYSFEINGKRFEGERSWDDRWTLIKNAMDYRDKRILDLGCNVGIAGVYLMKYSGAASCKGVDRPDQQLLAADMPRLMEAASYFYKAFNVPKDIVQLDLNHSSYEDILGSDYNIVICMSILKWIDDKERFLKYLSRFRHILYEGHDPDEIEIARFKRLGYLYEVLGETHVGISYPDNAKRTLIHFFKKDQPAARADPS